MKNKIKLIIIILLIILICAIVIVILNPTTKTKRDLNKVLSDEFIDEENIVFPDELYKLIAAYEGDATTQISNAYYILATRTIPKYYTECKNLSTEDLNQYFKHNENTIYIELGYSNVDEFIGFMNQLKKITGNELSLQSYSLDGDAIKPFIEHYAVPLTIQYKDNEAITFTSKVLRKIPKDRIPIILEAK